MLFSTSSITVTQKKILTEVIQQIINHYTTYIIDNDESNIKNIPFNDYVKIIQAHFKISDFNLIKNDFNKTFRKLNFQRSRYDN